MNKRFLKGLAALIVGIAIIYFGDRLLGVKLELFSGLSTFNLAWALDVFLVPFLMGMVVAVIFGREGHSEETFRFTKGVSMVIWLCYFPPLIVRSVSYAEIYYVSGVPEGSALMPWGLWACFVVMTMTTAGLGEIFAEIILKTYGKSNQTAAAGKMSSDTVKVTKL